MTRAKDLKIIRGLINDMADYVAGEDLGAWHFLVAKFATDCTYHVISKDKQLLKLFHAGAGHTPTNRDLNAIERFATRAAKVEDLRSEYAAASIFFASLGWMELSQRGPVNRRRVLSHAAQAALFAAESRLTPKAMKQEGTWQKNLLKKLKRTYGRNQSAGHSPLGVWRPVARKKKRA